MRLGAVIPSRTMSNVAACLRSIDQYDRAVKRLVVDDGIEWDFADCGGVAWEAVRGEKPFVFARNCNAGLRYFFDVQSFEIPPFEEDLPADGVFLMNDDATLITPGGFTAIAEAAVANPEYGLVSAAITGAVENQRQLPRGVNLRNEHGTLNFVCVYIPRSTWETVGLLDESFNRDYGWEDHDYCRRVKQARLELGIHDGCRVEHGRLPSTFRPGNVARNIFNGNGRRYFEKWGDLSYQRVPGEWRISVVSH